MSLGRGNTQCRLPLVPLLGKPFPSFGLIGDGLRRFGRHDAQREEALLAGTGLLHRAKTGLADPGGVADALQEALVQDYDGLIRVAPAIPLGWDFDGSVYVRGRTKVDAQIRNGVVATLVIEAGTTEPFKIRNPWTDQSVVVVTGAGTNVLKGAIGPVIAFQGIAGTKYLVEKHGEPILNRHFALVSGSPARVAKQLGPVQLGLSPISQ